MFFKIILGISCPKPKVVHFCQAAAASEPAPCPLGKTDCLLPLSPAELFSQYWGRVSNPRSPSQMPQAICTSAYMHEFQYIQPLPSSFSGRELTRLPLLNVCISRVHPAADSTVTSMGRLTPDRTPTSATHWEVSQHLPSKKRSDD